MVKNLPATQETQVPSLGKEDPLEKGMNGNPLQYFRLENSTEKPDGLLTVHEVSNSSDIEVCSLVLVAQSCPTV